MKASNHDDCQVQRGTIQICTACGIEKTIDKFDKRKNTKAGIKSHCKECSYAKFKARKASDPEKARIQQKTSNKRYHEKYPGKNSENSLKSWRKLDASLRVQRLRKRNLKSYGLDESIFAGMLLQQNNTCAICLNPEKYMSRGKVRNLCVDHDHKTGEVRGLLCGDCNRAIGLLGDCVENIEAAIAYLEKFT